MQRRSLFAGIGLAAMPALAVEGPRGQVYAVGDGIPMTAGEYAALLGKLTVEKDNYSLGGVVEELEQRVARELGKEAAVWMPTGTLANHMAVRMLAGEKRRVVVQAESHLLNDCGDCAQTLSGLHMVGLGAGKATFGLEELEEAVARAGGSRVRVPIGALQIETPVRRMRGARFDFGEMKKISAYARERGIGRHLDGARLFIESAYTGVPVAEYAALFDTVYVSMYKYFNGASGAVLAGPKALLEGSFHTRRMFGGGLHEVWPMAAVARHFFEGFGERMKKAVAVSEAVFAELGKDGNFEVERVAGGTNICRMRVRGVNAPVYQERLLHAGVTIGGPVNEWFGVQVNETWLRAESAEIAGRFRRALG